MHGIELQSGVNDCNWNIGGKCTNQRITRNKNPSGFSRDWDSKQNCTLTQVGVCLCSEYYQESVAAGCKNRRRKTMALLDKAKVAICNNQRRECFDIIQKLSEQKFAEE